MNHIEEARNFRKAMTCIASTLDDAKASTVPQIFDGMQYNGKLIKAGTRIRWGNVLKRSTVDIWDTKENNPDNAPTLWNDLLYRDGFRIIPEVITVTLAFSEGECGWWGDKLYRSKVGGNVYTPAVYPGNWEEVYNGEN